LDRYQKKLHILDPKETSPENEEKEKMNAKRINKSLKKKQKR
jgi:hypothetical protein